MDGKISREYSGTIVSVQVLRGIAALLVVVAHSFDQMPTRDYFLSPASGHSGVDLFFVISGFVMVLIYNRKPVGSGAFLLNRAIRIVPIYWIATVLLALAAILTSGILRGTSFDIIHFIQSMLFIPHVNPETGTYSPMLRLGWTLNFEVFFYAMFAISIGISGGVGVKYLIYALLVVGVLSPVFFLFGLLPVAILGGANFYFNSLVCEFAFGMFVAWFVREHKSSKVDLVVMFLFLVVMLFITSVTLENSVLKLFRGVLVGIPAAFVLVFALRSEEYFRMNHMHIFRIIGDASYSIYISHLFVLAPLRVAWYKYSLFASSSLDWLLVPVCVFCACAVGIIVHKFVELPVNAFVKKKAVSERKV